MGLSENIRKSEGFAALQPASKAQIDAAEKALKLHFSAEYRSYAEHFGAATLEDHELTGVCSPERINVVNVTQKARAVYLKLPQQMYVLEDLGIDRVYITQEENGSVYEYGPADKAIKIADSMNEYLFSEKDIG